MPGNFKTTERTSPVTNGFFNSSESHFSTPLNKERRNEEWENTTTSCCFKERMSDKSLDPRSSRSSYGSLLSFKTLAGSFSTGSKKFNKKQEETKTPKSFCLTALGPISERKCCAPVKIDQVVADVKSKSLTSIIQHHTARMCNTHFLLRDKASFQRSSHRRASKRDRSVSQNGFEGRACSLCVQSPSVGKKRIHGTRRINIAISSSSFRSPVCRKNVVSSLAMTNKVNHNTPFVQGRRRLPCRTGNVRNRNSRRSHLELCKLFLLFFQLVNHHHEH